jgi:hypothetical protein
MDLITNRATEAPAEHIRLANEINEQAGAPIAHPDVMVSHPSFQGRQLLELQKRRREEQYKRR